MGVAEIKVRNPAHSEFSFSSLEEFLSTIRSGGITADWEIWHQIASRWLPVSLHPLFGSADGRELAEP